MREIDTGTEDLLARVEDGVAVLTMNRPERRNALSPAMLSALADVLARVEVADDVGCVVLTGSGGAFCAGGDVKGMSESNAQQTGGGRRRSIDEVIHLQRLSQRATAGRLFETGNGPHEIASRPVALAETRIEAGLRRVVGFDQCR